MNYKSHMGYDSRFTYCKPTKDFLDMLGIVRKETQSNLGKETLADDLVNQG